MKLYAGINIVDFTASLGERLLTEINEQPENYILNVNIDDYTMYLVSKYRIDTPQLHFDRVFVDSTEKDIPASRFPRHDFMFQEDTHYRREVFIYHIPYTGNVNILQYRPNPRTLNSVELKDDSRQSCLLIEVINFYNDSEKIKQAYQQKVNEMKTNYDYLCSNCSVYNNNLPYTIKSSIESRKDKLLAKNNLMASLGVPIKKREDVVQTFSVPNPSLKDKVIIAKPFVKNTAYVAEPTLDRDNYRKILKIINDVGKNLERLPSTYKGKCEEDIRDYILIVLDPNFELGSASGETFNKTGKTDICLRYDSSVVFIAECKYWKGEKSFLKTIDQLLSYLTWRDSKVAIINCNS